MLRRKAIKFSNDDEGEKKHKDTKTQPGNESKITPSSISYNVKKSSNNDAGFIVVPGASVKNLGPTSNIKSSGNYDGNDQLPIASTQDQFPPVTASEDNNPVSPSLRTLTKPEASSHYYSAQQLKSRRQLPQKIAMGSDEDPKEYDRLRQLFRRGLIAAEVFGVTMCILILVWTTFYAGGIAFLGSGDVRVINLHVVLMIFFMVYLHGHAALIYRIFPTQPKYTVKLLHGFIHLMVCIGIGCGLAASVEQHNIKGAPHFYSLHSWLGIVSIVLYYAQFLAGFFTFLLPYAPMSLRTTVLPYHQFTGQVLFSLVTGSAISGIMLKAIGTIGDAYQNLPPTALVLNTAGFCVLTFSVIVGNLLGDHRFRRRARPEGELLLAETGAGGSGGGAGSE